MLSPRKSCYNFLNSHAGQTCAFPGGASGKEPASSAGDIREVGLILGSGRSPGGGHGNLLQPVFLPEESHGQRSLAGYSP